MSGEFAMQMFIAFVNASFFCFHRTSGGSCNGGDHVKAYEFIYKYGIADDTCAPFAGLNWRHGFEVAAMTSVEDVQGHQCHTCDWEGSCGFVPK